MDPATTPPAEPSSAVESPSGILAVLGAVGVVSYGLALCAAEPVQFKVGSHTTVWFEGAWYWPATLFAIAVSGVVLLLAAGVARQTPASTRWALEAPASNRRRTWRVAASLLWPMLLSAPLAAYVFLDALPPFFLSFLLILAGGWTAFEAGCRLRLRRSLHSAHRAAVASIILLIALATVVHTAIQINFFEHFMLGHADIGHFTEELKNALAGRGLRSDSFENTRLGWHFVPLMYLLVPGYALWPSPVYLMVCGALVVHLAALPVYYLARRLSGSALIGWMWAVAWLLLPSQSRLVYGNTYGFQWNNVTMLVLALVIASAMTRRRRTSLILVAVLLLCRETAAAAVFGWGLYLVLFTPRRKTGAVIAGVSIAYFLLCANVLIPQFASAGRYERLDLFGELGTTLGDLISSAYAHPEVFFGRLMRRQVVYYLLILLVPMALIPVHGWRMAIAAVPTFILVALLENEEWLSIKFWHQATILPFLFFGALTSMQRVQHGRNERSDASSTEGCAEQTTQPENVATRRAASASGFNLGLAAAVLISAALGHYFYGFSPISKAYAPYAAATFLHEPDLRMATVDRLRADLSRDHTIHATERLAAHFTDYKRLYTGGQTRPVDFVLIDRSDTWDTSGLPQAAGRFADDADYRLYGEFGSIIVFERNPDAPPVPLD